MPLLLQHEDSGASSHPRAYARGAPAGLEKSDHEKVEEIDRLMSEAIEAAKRDDRETVKTNIKKIREFRK